MMEDCLINPKIFNYDYLMFDSSIRKIQGQNIGLSCNLVDSSRESRGQQQFQEKKMQVYQSKNRLDMEIEELRLLMVKMSQRINEESMNIYISKENRQNSDRRRL